MTHGGKEGVIPATDRASRPSRPRPTATTGGARCFGALQMLVEPTGRRMAGKWVGFGKEFDVNTGPWRLEFIDADTGKATITKYNRVPE